MNEDKIKLEEYVDTFEGMKEFFTKVEMNLKASSFKRICTLFFSDTAGDCYRDSMDLFYRHWAFLLDTVVDYLIMLDRVDELEIHIFAYVVVIFETCYRKIFNKAPTVHDAFDAGEKVKMALSLCPNNGVIMSIVEKTRIKASGEFDSYRKEIEKAIYISEKIMKGEI